MERKNNVYHILLSMLVIKYVVLKVLGCCCIMASCPWSCCIPTVFDQVVGVVDPALCYSVIKHEMKYQEPLLCTYILMPFQ